MLFDALGRTAFRLVHDNCLVYAASWEDPRVDIEALGLDSSSRLLVISAAGCNVLDYALEGPALIDAVDVNYRQTALLELKLAAIGRLDWGDAFALFGDGHHPGATELYRDCLRESLSTESQQFWDAHIRMFSGRLPFYFRTTSGWFALWFRRYIAHVLRLWPEVEALINAASIEEQREVYDGRIKSRFWKPALGWALKRDAVLALSAIPPAQRRRMLRDHPDVLSYLRGKAEHIIYNQSLRDNYFWRVYLTGQFSVDCCPRYLQQSTFKKLNAGLLPAIRPATRTLSEKLAVADSPYTHFVLLDHMDWLA
ncbi:MAG: BtaA family protein, partial [Planctomycetales bacterium]|nr:BtaA family protein [Planctomycetales bacterium]